MTDTRDALMVARKTDGGLVRRPLSPHLQVYRPQITSALSIFHRITGVALTGAAGLLVWWLVAAATSPGAFAVVRTASLSWPGLIVLFGWTLALMFHTLNGIRHLAWDAGWGFELPRVHATGYAVLAATLVLTVAAWIVGWLVW